MRLIREITAEEENFRLEPWFDFPGGGGARIIRRDPVEPEPVGTLLLVPMRIVGYDPDCDGSLMARLEGLSFDDMSRADEEEAHLTHWGLYPNSGFVVTLEEVRQMVEAATPGGNGI